MIAAELLDIMRAGTQVRIGTHFPGSSLALVWTRTRTQAQWTYWAHGTTLGLDLQTELNNAIIARPPGGRDR